MQSNKSCQMVCYWESPVKWCVIVIGKRVDNLLSQYHLTQFQLQVHLLRSVDLQPVYTVYTHQR